MGEWSKRIGEVGESIVGEFFGLVGWSDAQKGVELKCNRGERHGTDRSEKITHGIDYFYSYESSLVDRTLDHLVISVKYKAEKYPSSLTALFKNHFFDLAKTMECFKLSPQRQETNKNFSNVSQARDIGVLFWLSNDISDEQDLICKLASSRNIDEYKYGTIYLVDNKRFSFIFDSVNYAKNFDKYSFYEFFYPATGRNINPSARKSSGIILPVEYINSSILLMKVVQTDDNYIFLITCIDNFHKDRLKRVVGLAHEITQNLTTHTIISFPNYDALHHFNEVKDAKSRFKDKKFTDRIEVTSFRSDFRSLNNE